MKTRVGEVALPGQEPSIKLSPSQQAKAAEEEKALLDMQDELRMIQRFPSDLGRVLMQRVINGINGLRLREEDGPFTFVEAYPPHTEASETAQITPFGQTILGVNPPDFINS